MAAAIPDLAQLEEHPLDVRKVSGSNPLMSTTKPLILSGFFFCLHKSS